MERRRGEGGFAKEAASRAALVVASAALALFAGELMARLWSDEVYLQNPLDWGGLWVPYVQGAEADLLTDEFRVRYTIGARGLRGPDRDWDAPPPGGRILLLGDSFAAGWGVSYEETFAARLEQQARVEVVDAGLPGGCPLWYVHQARLLPRELGASALVVQLFDNDPSDNVVTAPYFAARLGEAVGELPAELRRDRAPGRVAYLLRFSVLRRRLLRLVALRRGNAVTRQPFVEPGARPEANIMTREQAIARYRITFGRKAMAPEDCRFYDDPDGPIWGPKLDWQRLLVGQLLDESAARSLPVALVYVPAYQWFLWGYPASENPHAALLWQACAERGVPFLDGALALGALPEPAALYHPRDGHLNGAGHAALARALWPVVEGLRARVGQAARPGRGSSSPLKKVAKR